MYFITACTHNRARLLANAEINDAFLHFCIAAKNRGIFVGRYVIMPDHLHLFAAFSLNSMGGLSEWTKSLKNSLSRTLRANGIRAPHWQKGFFDHILRSEESYSEKWAYVLLNPVRAGLVDDANDWPYQGEVHPLRLESL